MTSPGAQEHCPDCGRAVQPGADLCSCGFPLMFLRQDEPERAVLKPSRRPAQDDDTDELPVVEAPVLRRVQEPVVLDDLPPDGLVCASCDEVNPQSRTWCAHCGAALRVRSEPVEAVVAPAPRPRGRGLLVGGAVLVVLVVAAGVGAWVLSRDETPDVGTLTIRTVTPSATSTPGVDNDDRPVTYVGDHVKDGEPTTAWRVDGDGVGVHLDLDLGAERTVTEVALVPGYAKDDPVRTAGQTSDRFQDNGRVTRVRWEFGDGQVLVQRILSPSRAWARAPLEEPVTTSRVRLVIEESQAGTRAAGRTTAISEVQVIGR